MKTAHLKRVRRLFVRPDVPRHVARHNMLAWVKSVRHLGQDWLLAKPLNRN